MRWEIDHVFICTAENAPAAEHLKNFGLTEGSPNIHPGQGTACRRFFFSNAMLELPWVADSAEARSEQTRPTRLWDRWSDASGACSPFGIILRPRNAKLAAPFAAWTYAPPTMPGLVLQIASNTSLAEPMWCYMERGFRPDEAPPERRQPMVHSAGINELTAVRLRSPALPAECVAATMARLGVITHRIDESHTLELEFDHARQGQQRDCRPELPLVTNY